MEKCKKHRQPILACQEGCDSIEECVCHSVCSVCVRVEKRKYNDAMKKCNWVIEIFSGPLVTGSYSEKVMAIKFKPHMKLSKGSYAVLNPKTGYLERSKGPHVQFYVVQ